VIGVALVAPAWLVHEESRLRSPIGWVAPVTARRVTGLGSLLGDPSYRTGFASRVVLLVLRVLLLVAWRGGRLRRDLVPVVAWAVGAPIVLVVLSLVKPVEVPRYASVAVPGLCLLTATLLLRVPRRLGLAAFGILVAAWLAADLRQATEPTKPDWRRAAGIVTAATSHGATLVVFPADKASYLAYSDPALRVHDLVAILEWHDTPLPGRVVLLRQAADPWRLAAGPPTRTLITTLTRTGRPVVVVIPTSIRTAQRVLVDTTARPSWVPGRCQTTRQALYGIAVFTVTCPTATVQFAVLRGQHAADMSAD
jgi:hypothetical protein